MAITPSDTVSHPGNSVRRMRASAGDLPVSGFLSETSLIQTLVANAGIPANLNFQGTGSTGPDGAGPAGTPIEPVSYDTGTPVRR